MVRIYRASLTRFVPGLLYLTIFLGAIAMGGFRAGTTGGFVISLVSVGTLGVVYGRVFHRRRQPLVLMEGNRILIRPGRRQEVVQDVRSYELVLNADWLGFRRPGVQDIMIGAGEMSAKSWHALVSDLSALPFSNVLWGSYKQPHALDGQDVRSSHDASLRMNAQSVKTLMLVGVVLALSLFRGGDVALWSSFAFVVAVLIFLPWAMYSMIRMIIRPNERRLRGTRLVVWATTLFVALGIKAYWDTAAREKATSVASAIQAYKARTGAYPSTLGDVGFNAVVLQKDFSLSYRLIEGKAALFYSQPSMPLVAHHYNFESHSWRRVD